MQNELSHLHSPKADPQVTVPADEHDIMACPYLLAEEDMISLKQLAPGEIQQWCLSRISEHRNHNRLLHERYGAAARNTVSQHKCHIRALRSVYNNAAPINQSLPPDVLKNVFSHVHPATMPRLRVPVLRVCRYWRRLIFRTPRFWANLLSLPTWKAWNPKHRMGPFQAALARSAPERLTLSVPYYTQVIIDTLTPHANRLSSLKVGPTLYENVETAQIQVAQQLPCLTHLPIHTSSRTSTLTFNFPVYPNIQSLELQHTYLYAPVTPYSSLCHLRLDHCTVRRSSTADPVPLYKALECFPNLETLSLVCSLTDADPDSLKTVHLPRLRHLELADLSDYIRQFILHLVFPSTTSLVLEPTHFGGLPATASAIPLFPDFNPSPAPHAELTLHLVFRGPHDEQCARWETRGAGVRRVRVTLANAASDAPAISRSTRSLVAALAPPPARGLTALALASTGMCTTYRYWADLLPALPALQRLTYAVPWDDAKALLWQLEQPRAGLHACPALEDVALEWHLPPRLDYGLDSGDWQALRDRDHCGPRPRHGGPPRSELGLAASLGAFCDVLGACLGARAGQCAPMRRLAVALCPSRVDAADVVLEGWQMALVGERLRDRLGDLVEDIAVVGHLQ